MTTLLGVVLCGGHSSRMGTDKALLQEPGGATFLEHAAMRLTALCDTVCLSGPDRYATPYRTIVDATDQGGPLVGVLSALVVARQESYAGCLITPVDTPALTIEDLRSLRDAWLKSPATITCAVCETEPFLQPLIAIYPTQILETLQELASRGDRSLLRWLRTSAHQAVPLPNDSCVNINSPEDLPPG